MSQHMTYEKLFSCIPVEALNRLTAEGFEAYQRIRYGWHYTTDFRTVVLALDSQHIVKISYDGIMLYWYYNLDQIL